MATTVITRRADHVVTIARVSAVDEPLAAGGVHARGRGSDQGRVAGRTDVANLTISAVISATMVPTADPTS